MVTELTDVDLLIRGATVVTMDAGRRIYNPGAVAVAGDRIVRVGPEREVSNAVRADRVLSAGSSVLHPGLVDAHVHVGHGLLRAPCPDGIDWDQTIAMFLRDYWNLVDDRHEYAGSLVALLDLIRSGTTCFIEPGTIFEPDTLAQAAELIGIRALVADGFICDQGSRSRLRRAPSSTGQAIARLGRQLSRNADPNALVRGCVALIGSGTASDELMLAAKQTASESHGVMTAHQSWHRHDWLADELRFGCSAIEYYERLGVLDRSTLLSQVNFLGDDDLPRLIESEAAVAWAPVVAGIWTTEGGVSRHAELHRRGGTVGLGTDGTLLGIPLDLTGAAREAVIMSRRDGLGRGALVAEDAFEMMTLGGARALGLEHEIGSIEPGKRADLVLRAIGPSGLSASGGLISQLVYSGRTHGVQTVIVGGRTILSDGAFVSVDEARERAIGEQLIGKLMREMGWNNAPRWPVFDGEARP